VARGFYLTRAEAPAGPPPVMSAGCFWWYSRLDEGRIRLHFRNAETDGQSPLAAERLDRRMAAPAALFHHVKRTWEFRSMPLWGQFLDRHGEIRERARRDFVERLDRQSGMDRLDLCFPLQVLSLEASATEVHDFHRI
jgi:hypothetical protein